MDWNKELKAALKKGRLTVGDLRWYFQTGYWTVRQWAVNDRCPNGAKADHLYARLQGLHELISRGWLPVPGNLNKPARAEYMRLLGRDDFGRAQLLADDPAGSGLVHRVRVKGAAKKAGSIRGRRQPAGMALPARRTRV
jgi:hypothetical protein